jgi:hypothetical protein
LALPTDRSDTFFKEVDENLRRDRARDFAQKHGTLIIAAVVLFLAAVGGWIYWQGRQKEKAAEQSEQLSQIYTDIGSGKTDNVPQRLDALSDDGNVIVRASALFARASVALQQGDRNLAITKFREAQNDDGLPQAYRDLALVRLTALEFDSLKPEQVIARLQPLATAGNPWFGSAGELTAMALLKQGKKPEAGRLFAAIAADRQVPETMRSRAVQIAGTLGVDASASMPALLQ